MLASTLTAVSWSAAPATATQGANQPGENPGNALPSAASSGASPSPSDLQPSGSSADNPTTGAPNPGASATPTSSGTEDTRPDVSAPPNTPSHDTTSPDNTASDPTSPDGAAPNGAPGQQREPAKQTPFVSRAFDTCSTPSVQDMSAWWGTSPYKAVGIYIGGANRGCKQKNLTPNWVKKVTQQGWKLIPIYVGSQASCTKVDKKYHISTSLTKAKKQGTTQGKDAVNAAAKLGLAAGSPLHLDMEAYETGKDTCSESVLTFAAAWNHAVNKSGYLSGYYSSAASGITDLVKARRSGRSGPEDLPDVLWYARWDGKAKTTGEKTVPDSFWKASRMHQYKGNVKESHGGVKMSIDRDVVHAPVAVVE